MKRLLQLIGIRKWSGEDLVSLQAEPLKTIDAFFATYGNSIFNGCEVTPAADNVYNITPGFVALQGKDQDNQDTFKVAPFPGLENVALPVYLTLSYNVIEKEYVDGKVKPAAYDYHATASSIRPEDGTPYLEITATGGRRFIDAVGITQKLDKTGNGKDVTVTFAQAADRVNVDSGEKLSALWGKVCRFFADLKTVAFTGKAADLTEDATHRLFTDVERTKLGGVADNANNYRHPDTHSADIITDSAAKVVMTKPERDKLAGISAGANAYTHPTTHDAGIIVQDATHRFATDAEKQGWNSKAAGDHNHNTIYAGINHNHTGVYQPAGNYSIVGHGHTAGEVSEDATHRFATDAEKQGWNSKATGDHNHDAAYSVKAHNHAGVYQPAGNYAAGGHNHDTTYQPKGNYSTVGHGHTATDITEQTNKRFLTDVERTKIGFLANIEDAGDVLRVICAGFIDGAGRIRGFWGKKRVDNQVFTVSYSSTGVYTITHNFGGSGYGVIANARYADGLLFVGVVSRVDNSFTMAATDTGNYRDAEIYFIVYKM